MPRTAATKARIAVSRLSKKDSDDKIDKADSGDADNFEAEKSDESEDSSTDSLQDPKICKKSKFSIKEAPKDNESMGKKKYVKLSSFQSYGIGPFDLKSTLQDKHFSTLF